MPNTGTREDKDQTSRKCNWIEEYFAIYNSVNCFNSELLQIMVHPVLSLLLALLVTST